MKPLIELLIFHTNRAAQDDPELSARWKPMTVYSARCWLACRYEIREYCPSTGSQEKYWESNHYGRKHMSYHRYTLLERYLSVNSDEFPSKGETRWFWKVSEALDKIRKGFAKTLIPSSILVVNELTIPYRG